MLDDFKFLKSVATRTPKVCMPAPTYLHLRGGRKVVSENAYPDMDAFWDDIVAAYRAEIADLAAAGATYIQLDDVSFAALCDPTIRAQIAADGEEPDRLPAFYASVINRIIAGSARLHVSVTMHTCRGNHDSMWMASRRL